MMPTHQSSVGTRLARLLRDLGYASEVHHGALQLDRVAEIANRATPGASITRDMLRGYIYRGQAMNTDVAVALARGLRFNVLDLLYDQRPGMVKRRRPKGTLDEVDQVIV